MALLIKSKTSNLYFARCDGSEPVLAKTQNPAALGENFRFSSRPELRPVLDDQVARIEDAGYHVEVVGLPEPKPVKVVARFQADESAVRLHAEKVIDPTFEEFMIRKTTLDGITVLEGPPSLVDRVVGSFAAGGDPCLISYN